MRNNLMKKLAAGSVVCSVLMCYAMPAIAYTNDETVYSNLKSDGSSYKTTVSTVEGEENNTKVNKEEVEKDLPIECKVTYTLDGKEMSAKEIAGKKGKVTISLKYTNKAEQQVWINGQNEKMYTPFLVVSGVMIDNKNNKNIEVNHGKVINNGDKTIAAGFAVPGLAQSLKLNNSELEVCDTIEISMETECFELKNIMTFASPKVFDSKTIKMSDFNELFSKVNDLQNASTQIEGGAKSLNDGIILLDTGIGTLKDGSDTLNGGVTALKQGANELNNGANRLNNGYSAVDEGIRILNDKSGDLESGAKELATGTTMLAGGMNELSEGISGAANSFSTINDGAQSAKDGIAAIVSEMNKQMSTASQAGTPQAVSDNINLISDLQTTNETLSAKLDDDTLDESVKSILEEQIRLNNESIEKLTASNQCVQNTLQASEQSMKSLYDNLVVLQGGIDSIATGTSAMKDGLDTIDNSTKTLATSSTALAKGAGSLHDGTETLSEGTSSLAEGSSQVANGIQDLSEGTSSLVEGANALSNGATSLVQGVNSLADGSKQLVDGSGTLYDGIAKFNSEGIDNICNLINNNGKNLIRRIEKLQELSDSYDSFTSDKKRDNLQFISIMDGINAPDAEKKKNS